MINLLIRLPCTHNQSVAYQARLPASARFNLWIPKDTNMMLDICAQKELKKVPDKTGNKW
jgi:hypothetical protein